MRVEPFTVAIPQASLDDLRTRLERVRWPDRGAGDWQDGTDLAYLRDVVSYWRDGYDWRRAEARLNALPAVRVRSGDLGIHALHAHPRIRLHSLKFERHVLPSALRSGIDDVPHRDNQRTVFVTRHNHVLRVIRRTSRRGLLCSRLNAEGGSGPPNAHCQFRIAGAGGYGSLLSLTSGINVSYGVTTNTVP